MISVKVYSQEGQEVGTMNLKGGLWKEPIHTHALYLTLRRELAVKRAGTHATKTRSEVSGSGKKPWRQKGTGRARAGSVRSPLWRHGGVVFGPHPRKHGFALQKEVNRLALRSALQNLLASDKFIVLDKLEISEAKTKNLVLILNQLKADKVLILIKETDEKLKRASQNLSRAKLLPLTQLNVHDLLRFKKVLLTKETFNTLEKVMA